MTRTSWSSRAANSAAWLALLVLLGLLGAGCRRSTADDVPRAPPPGPPQPGIPSAIGSGKAPSPVGSPPDAAKRVAAIGRGPGFAASKPWVSFYGTAAQMRDLAKVAATYRIINIDADPDAGNFTSAQVKTLQAGGKNRVLSYLNLGSCESFRGYWSKAPAGFAACGDNRAAHLGKYEGYANETWMDPSNLDYQKLIVEHVAPRLASRGVDGFYLDNLELLGHGVNTTNGPCNERCRQGGLDLVRRLREKFPDLLLVMQNGTSDVTRLGVTGGLPFPSLLDGIAHEEVFAPQHDPEAERELLAWQSMHLESRNGHPLWIAVEDYVGSCKRTDQAREAIAKAEARGFSSYVSDESGGQKVVCYW